MRCEACHQSIALAKRCPYCGHVQKSTQTASEHGRSETDEQNSCRNGRSAPRGEFKGRVDGKQSTSTSSGSTTPTLGAILRYLMDPHVPATRKWLLYLAIFYVLSPIDFIPGGLFPVLGWLDDLGVIMLTWRWLGRELSRTFPS